ncbi:cupin domain-containing protein [Pacificispira sp.]|uniref:cupin domain-containing protein n=1 Tax=Pacificispira sp. TaxID=2888761 RepID=UPI003B52E74F
MKKMALAMSVAAGCVLALPALAQDNIRGLNVEDMPFETTPEGVAFAALEGERFEEAYMAMVRLPAGLDSPPHVKSAAMFGVMVSGEMTHTVLGADLDKAPVLRAGAYYHIPANVPHVSRCVSDVDCVTFLYQDGAFDFIPVEVQREED